MSAFSRFCAGRIFLAGLGIGFAMLRLPGCDAALAAAQAQKAHSAALAAAPAQKSNSGAVLPGGNSKKPINIEAAKLDYFDKEQKLVYTGNVVATQGESTLKTATLIIFLTPKEPGDPAGAPSNSSEVQRMEAPGPVTITSKDQIGTGDSGVYLKSEKKVYLIGNVTLTQGANVTKGDKLVYDLNTKQSVVTGRVRSMFLPSDNDDANRKTPAKTQ